LQKNPEMIRTVLHPQLDKRPVLNKLFKKRDQKINLQISSLRKIDPQILTPASRAGYDNNLEALQKTNHLDQPDASGRTPLHYAILLENMEAIQYLSTHSNLFALTPQGHSYLDYAIASKNFKIYQMFEELNLPFT